MQKQNPDWFYKYSEILKQNIVLNRKTGLVYCEDGTKYSSEENAIEHRINHKKNDNSKALFY